MWLNKQDIEEELYINPPFQTELNFTPEYIHFPFKEGRKISVAECGTIVAQYKKAMAKHSSYRYNDLSYHIRNYSVVLKYKHSYLIGYNQIDGRNRKLFLASHFAPFSCKEGVEMLTALRNSDTVSIFAVTDYLGNMLRRLGYIYVCETPQLFAGDIVMKQVFINNERFLNLAKLIINR